MAREPFFLLLLAALACLLRVTPAEAGDEEWGDLDRPQQIVVPGVRLDIDVRKSDRTWKLEISQADNSWTLLTVEDESLYLHQPSLGADITGSGRPHIAFFSMCAGSGCRPVLHLVDLRETGLVHLVLSNLGWPSLADLDGKPGWEVSTGDDWHEVGSCNACGAYPPVVLRFAGMRLVLASDLMRKAPPTAEDVAKEAAEVREKYEPGFVTDYEDSIRQGFLTHIYQGNLPTACRFLDAAWPTVQPAENGDYGRDQFLGVLLGQVRANINGRNGNFPGLWAAIAELNGVAVDGELACPPAPQ